MSEKRSAGRPQSQEYHQLKARILRLKCSIDPDTGNIFTFEKIGKLLGMTKGGVAHYIPAEKGNCPRCHRPLEKHLE